jgi:hypothetical protein
MSDIEQLREGLEAAIRAAKLALFVIRKQGVICPTAVGKPGLRKT